MVISRRLHQVGGGDRDDWRPVEQDHLEALGKNFGRQLRCYSHSDQDLVSLSKNKNIIVLYVVESFDSNKVEDSVERIQK